LKIEVEAIGFVRGGRREAVDDAWAGVRATIDLDPTRFSAKALSGLEDFSHVEVLIHFHQADPKAVEYGARRPRGNEDWPRVGIFAQRGKDRPNRLGISICRLLEVDDVSLKVEGLDAIDGTPVLDIKPLMSGLGPRGGLREPEWAREIMAKYWK